MKMNKAFALTCALLLVLVLTCACRVRIIDGEKDGSSGAYSSSRQASDNASNTNSAPTALIEGDYSGLLDSGTGKLFPCEYLTVYFESANGSAYGQGTAANSVIVGASAENVAALSRGENKYNDAWIASKNPDLIVKCVERGKLGGGVYSLNAANTAHSNIYARAELSATKAVKNRRVVVIAEELLETENGRLSAKLIIASALYPALFTTLDINEMTQTLLPNGLYYYGI